MFSSVNLNWQEFAFRPPLLLNTVPACPRPEEFPETFLSAFGIQRLYSIK